MMRLNKYMASQAIRYIETDGAENERQSPVPFIRQFEDRYGFAQVPHTLAELNLKTGVIFLRGYFKGKIIDKFQVYENGFLCEAHEDNALCDEFIDDVLSWVPQLLKKEIRQSTLKAYLSQIEITATSDLNKVFNKLLEAGTLISSLLKNYGQLTEPFGISGFKMHYDIHEKPFPRSPEFLFERRAGESYDKQTYFSSAPLRSDDHLKVLEVVEAAFA